MTNDLTICVCGAGTMGSGIAQVFAQKDFRVILFDTNANGLAKAKARIEKFAPNAINQINFTSSVNDCISDVIIEAIIENADIKLQLFTDLARINSSKTIFTTNTSSLSVDSLSNSISHPERFAGMHFFNPAPLMKLVEIVKSTHTSSTVINTLTTIVHALEKTPVVCKDSPGFIVNRVARPYYLEALRVIENDTVTIEAIDQLMEATGFKMGPFRLMDLIGNDINFSVSNIVYDALGQPARLKPSVIQEKKVKEGSLGRKTGKGYYEYPAT